MVPAVAITVEHVGLADLLARADVISLHARVTSETTGLIDGAALAQVNPGAFLINTARGPLVDYKALFEVLSSGRLAGAMLDTRNKISGRLRDVLAPDQLAGFISECRQQGLMCGLAGSLRIEDIPILARLSPDYLGFRGGLCRAGDRTGRLDPQAIQRAAGAVAAANGGDRAE